MKINYLNKKLVTGALAFTLVATSLTGCAKNSFSYSKDTRGNITVAGEIDYDILERNYEVIEVHNKITNENNIYIVQYENGSYIDIFTDKVIHREEYSNPSFEILKEENIGYYLVTFDKTKASYTIDELKDIYNIIKEHYIYVDNDKSTSYKRVLTNNNI